MMNWEPQSFFHDIIWRELSGFKMRKQPIIEDFSLSSYDITELTVDSDELFKMPLAISFCKAMKNEHILGLAFEDGCLSFLDTRREFSSNARQHENTVSEKARVSSWKAHNEPLFDICSIKEDSQILTAFWDQTVKLWDVEEKKCTRTLFGHKGSVVSLSCHPTDTDIFASGARDGSFSLWDLRCKRWFSTSQGYPFIAIYLYNILQLDKGPIKCFPSFNTDFFELKVSELLIY